jgi:hypothetical protein
MPSPIPSFHLKNDSEGLSEVNFMQGGAGVTYAFGFTPLDTQMNDLESVVQKKALSKSHLRNLVALVSLGCNDYGAYNAYSNIYDRTKTGSAALRSVLASNLGFRKL